MLRIASPSLSSLLTPRPEIDRVTHTRGVAGTEESAALAFSSRAVQQRTADGAVSPFRALRRRRRRRRIGWERRGRRGGAAEEAAWVDVAAHTSSRRSLGRFSVGSWGAGEGAKCAVPVPRIKVRHQGRNNIRCGCRRRRMRHYVQPRWDRPGSELWARRVHRCGKRCPHAILSVRG